MTDNFLDRTEERTEGTKIGSRYEKSRKREERPQVREGIL